MNTEDVNLMAYYESYYWFWKARRNLIDRLVRKYASGTLALDVGCGVGNNMRVLQKIGYAVHGLDKSEKAVEYSSKIAEKVYNLDVADMGFNDKYDLILASDIIEHCDDVKAVRSMYGALKQGGILIATTAMFKHLWGMDDVRVRHLRRYSKKEMLELFKDFEIVKFSYIMMLPYFAAFIARRIERLFKLKTSIESFVKDRTVIDSHRSEFGKFLMMFALPVKIIFRIINSLACLEQYLENMIVAIGYLPFGDESVIVVKK